MMMGITKNLLITIGVTAIALGCGQQEKSSETTEGSSNDSKPNVIIFYIDDLGYGDVGAYGSPAVSTPNIDKMAANGLRLTDAHSGSATCTPSRYSLLTGTYAFRNDVSILPGDAPLLIDPEMPTLPKMLQEAGYKTAVVGKWHLGLGSGDIDWNKEVAPGPREVGFDYSFLIPATGDRVPTVYLEDQKVVNADPNDPIAVNYRKDLGGYPNGIDRPDLRWQQADKQHSGTIVNGISRIGYMSGGEKALWVDEDFPELLVDKCKTFISSAKNEPFFLFFSYHDIHVPRMPNEQFKGTSKMGLRGDVIAQMDWSTGQIMDFLKAQGLEENTLVIFTSDNGPVLNDGYEDGSMEKLGDHKPGGPFSGGKYSALEAGTRVPTIVHWPGKVKEGVSGALVSQTDFYASIASLVNHKLKDQEAMDSENVMPALLGTSLEGREFLLEESFTLGLRHKNWKYVQPTKKGSPGFITHIKNIRAGGSAEEQLFNLSRDTSEQKNIAQDHPQVVAEMKERLDLIIGDEKSNNTKK
ncbi:arylsulfatase [Muricauda sp. SCSIO 64092]|uniref:sulfatase family protein n=1 Tax=Allomuricauda sp. SCSIO 64092 TaxID=2908842 RepID=UPI001FF408AE|nr:arylsulfatase [Muricauda sp. SCSIO 64092]UOY06127.1 arylsulfatase [Muricauda sp. SCSIO 64092]